MQEQNKYDQIPLGIFDRLQRISPLAEKVADEIVCEETDILEEIIPRMFKVMRKVAVFSCDYVRRGRIGMRSSSSVGQILMDYSENGGWAGAQEDDQRHGERLDQGDRRF